MPQLKISEKDMQLAPSDGIVPLITHGNGGAEPCRAPAALGRSWASRSKQERPPAHHQLSHPAASAARKSDFFDSIGPNKRAW